MADHEESNETESLQINAAMNQRVAGRDYFEMSSPRSIRLALATWSTEKLNDLALDNARMFAHRFGFEARTEIRRDVLRIQKEYDLTDHEICSLHRGGLLLLRATKAELVPSRLAPISGWLLLIMLCLFCVSMTPIVHSSHTAPWRLALGQIMLVSMCLGVTWAVTTVFIKPWVILKRAGVLTSAAPT